MLYDRIVMKRLILALAVIALAGGGAWAYARQSVPAVELARPQTGLAVEAVYATGMVEPVRWARIGPVAQGRIAEMLVAEGERVKEGQPLARLDDREARARVAELEARAAYWREEVARTSQLTRSGIKAPEALQKAQSEYNQVTAAINAARQRRLDLVVTAPADGLVLRKDGEIGEVVKAEDTLFWIGDPSPLRITADVDEEDIARVKPGQKVLIKADAFAGQVLTGTVDTITPKGDPIAKSFRVRVTLPPDTPLLIGMTSEINIITAEKPGALLVPSTALQDNAVLVVSDGQTQSQTVRVGIRGRKQVEILSGLSADQAFIAKPPSGLTAGQKIRVP